MRVGDGRVGSGDFSPGPGHPAKQGLPCSQRRHEDPCSSGPAPPAAGSSRQELTCRRNRAACQSSVPTAAPRRVLRLCLPRPASSPSNRESLCQEQGRCHRSRPTRGRYRERRRRGRASGECPSMPGVGGVAVLLGRRSVIRRLFLAVGVATRWGGTEGVATRRYLLLLFGVRSGCLPC